MLQSIATVFMAAARSVPAMALCVISLSGGSAFADLTPIDPIQVLRETADPIVQAPNGTYRLAFSESATAAVEKRLQKGAAECKRLPWAYRYDCLAETFRSAARLNRDKPDYRDARAILGQAAKKLDALVDQNVDTARPVVKPGKKAFRPVQQTRKAAILKAGSAIIRDAETRLLRSGGIQKRQEHYQRIAAAVVSTELLLRASLLPIRPRLANVATLGCGQIAAFSLREVTKFRQQMKTHVQFSASSGAVPLPERMTRSESRPPQLSGHGTAKVTQSKRT